MPIKNKPKQKQKQALPKGLASRGPKQKQKVKVSQNVKVIVGDVRKKRAAPKQPQKPQLKNPTNISLNIVNPYNIPNVINPQSYLQYQAHEAKEVRENHQKIYDSLLRQQENRPVQQQQQQYYQPEKINWGNVIREEPKAEKSYADLERQNAQFVSDRPTGQIASSWLQQARANLAQQKQYEEQLKQDSETSSYSSLNSIPLQNAYQALYQGQLESDMEDDDSSIPPLPSLIQDQETQTTPRVEDYQNALQQGGAGAGAEDTPKPKRGPKGPRSTLDTPQGEEAYTDIYQKLSGFSDNELRKKQLTGNKLLQYAEQLGLDVYYPGTKKRIPAKELKETIIDLLHINRNYPSRKDDLPPATPPPASPPPQQQTSSKKKKRRGRNKKLVLEE